MNVMLELGPDEFRTEAEPPLPEPPPDLSIIPPKRSGPSPTALRVYTVRQLAELPSASEEFIVGGGLLTRGGKLLLYGQSGVGKTTLVDYLFAAIATGRPFLGRFPVDRARTVLVFQGELSLPEMADHATGLLSAGYAEGDRLLYVRSAGLKLPRQEPEMMALVAEHRPSVVGFDPWYKLFEGESSNSPEQVVRIFDVADRILDGDFGVEAVAVTHHANVTGLRTAGSWVFEGWPSTILRLERVAGVPSDRLLIVEKLRAPTGDAPERMTCRLGEEGYLLVGQNTAEPESGAILVEHILREAGGQLHRQELMARVMGRTRCKLRAANSYLGKAIQGGRVASEMVGQRAVYVLRGDR